MGFRSSACNKLRCAAEEGCSAGGGDQACHRTAPGDASGIGGIPRGFAHGERLPSQRGLVDAEIFSFSKQHIRRKNLARIYANHIAWNQVGRIDDRPGSATHDARFTGKAFLESGKRARCLVVLPEANRGVVSEEPNNDSQVGPVPPEKRD